jgi:hypothetical protein
MFKHPPKQLVWQQVHVFSEHAENKSVYEVRDSFGIVAAVAQALRQLREFGGRPSVKACRVLPGFRRSGSAKTHLSFCRTPASQMSSRPNS